MSDELIVSLIEEGNDAREEAIEPEENTELLNKIKAAKNNIREYCRNLQHPIEIQTCLEKEEKKKRTEIQKVPRIILQKVDFKKYFKPSELSIGPIHASDRRLLKRERIKLQFAANFFLHSGKPEEYLFKKIEEIKDEIKMYFNKKVINRYSDASLIRMLFLDGCAMLGFIHIFINKRLNEFNISDGQATLIQQDLFLLENQIPFIVLNVLMGFGREWENFKMKADFLKFIFLTSNATFPRVSVEHLHTYFDDRLSSKRKSQKLVHILDLLREVILFDTWFNHFESVVTPVRHIFCLLCCCGGAFVLVSSMMERFNKSHCLPTYLSKPKQSFRSVQELKTAGIKFKPSDSLTTISFHSRTNITAKLMLPTLVIDDSTKRKLFNLVAFEMCLSESHPNQKPWVTSYVNLLDLLVDNEEDVKDLRAADILHNFLSSDEDAAKLINCVGSKCFPPPKDAYADVKHRIEKHYRTKSAIWMAQVCDAHFSSPWTVLALIVGTAVLVLTAVQTWYTVYPRN